MTSELSTSFLRKMYKVKAVSDRSNLDHDHLWASDVSSFKFHILSLRRSVQDYKIHIDMEIVIFLESGGETNLEVYSNHMVQYSI